MTSDNHPRVLLVYPPYEQPLFRGGIYYTSIPLGLAYLAAALEKASMAVSVRDLNIDPISPGKFASQILADPPDIVGIYTTSLGLRYVRTLIHELGEGGITSGIPAAGRADFQGAADAKAAEAERAANRGAPKPLIAVGGPHISADPESSMLLRADAYFKGEAEHTFPEYCMNAGRYGGEEPNIPGGEEHRIRMREEPYMLECGTIKNLDSLPYPARHLFNEDKYRFTPIAASRGCPYGCTYCAVAGTQYRKRSLNNIRGEIDAILARKPLRSVDFTDDVFTIDKKYARDIASAMKEYGIPWACTTRADLVDRELLTHMADSGCTHISYGLESGSYRIRKIAGKDISDDAYRAAFKDTRDAGIHTRAYIMVGLPQETEEDIEKGAKLISSLEPGDVIYSPVVIYPQTKLMRYAVENGLVEKNAWAQYMLGKAGPPHFSMGGKDPEAAGRICYEESKRFYLTPKQILSRIRGAKNPADLVDCAKAAAAYVFEPLIR